MAIDAIVLGVDAIGEATGAGTFEYHPISKYGKSIEATGSGTTTALVTMVNGFADEWSDAIERAKHGDCRGVTDVSIDTYAATGDLQHFLDIELRNPAPE